MAKNIFFIVGCARSGTTLLQVMLSHGTDIAIPPETHFFKHILLRLDEFGDLQQENNFRDFLTYLFGTRCFRDLCLSTELFEERARESDRSARSIFLILMYEYLRKENKNRIGEKTPPHIHYVPDILTMLPDSRIVNIIRDPRDVVTSLKKVYWASNSVYGNMKRWLDCVRLHLKYVDTLPAGTYKSIKYEELVSSPTRILTEICRFLDITYTDSMLDFHSRDKKQYCDREHWKNNTSNPLNTKSIGRGARELNRYQLMIIEWMAQEEMALLGYEPRYSNHSFTRLLMWVSAIGHFFYLCRSALVLLFQAGPKALLRARPGK